MNHFCCIPRNGHNTQTVSFQFEIQATIEINYVWRNISSATTKPNQYFPLSAISSFSYIGTVYAYSYSVVLNFIIYIIGRFEEINGNIDNCHCLQHYWAHHIFELEEKVCYWDVLLSGIVCVCVTFWEKVFSFAYFDFIFHIKAKWVFDFFTHTHAYI